MESLMAMLLVLVVLGLALFLVIAVAIFLSVAVAIGVPVYFMGRYFSSRRLVPVKPVNHVEQLRTLYLDGKIDLFEFEQLVARHIAAER